MTGAEYEGWGQHLANYPPAEFILAAIWLTVSRALGNDQAKLEHMGYWLETPEMREERRTREAAAKRQAAARLTAAAYRRSKEH